MIKEFKNIGRPGTLAIIRERHHTSHMIKTNYILTSKLAPYNLAIQHPKIKTRNIRTRLESLFSHLYLITRTGSSHKYKCNGRQLTYECLYCNILQHA